MYPATSSPRRYARPSYGSAAVKTLGGRFDGAKRDYGQDSRRFVIPAARCEMVTSGCVALQF
jgi:hypothetical protein